MKNFVPKEFQVPDKLETDRFRLKMLTIHDVVKDYEAVMTSIEHLQKSMPFGPDHGWPTEELTLEQDLIDLGWHQKEFQRKSSFTYTVESLDERKCLGCLYIYPSPNEKYDARIVMWVRQGEIETGLDEHLYREVKKWVREKWPFKKPGYPGRDIDWESWNSLS